MYRLHIRENSKTLRAKLKESADPPWQLDLGWEREVNSRSDGEAEIIRLVFHT